MNLMTKILNALAFANVSNLGEFRSLLRQIDPPSAPVQDENQHRTISAEFDTPVATPGIRHAQGTL